MSELEAFRKDKDKLFGKDEQSPLTSKQKQNFKGLNYFLPNPNLVFLNLEVDKIGNGQTVQIKTSAGDTQAFKVLGKIHFTVAGTDCELNVYESTQRAGLFLPFRDKTNQLETYHDGRYVEIEEKEGKIVELDFNYAYNPYCAYNDNFRCPITPEENSLPIEIRAGEQKFP